MLEHFQGVMRQHLSALVLCGVWALWDTEDLENELIDTIYAALLGEVDWQVFLDRICASIPGSLATFFYHDFRSQTGDLAFVAGHRGREKALEEYTLYYNEKNPWMKKVAATPIGKGIIGEHIVDRGEFVRSEYYNDYFRNHKLETGIGLTLFSDDKYYFLLSLLTEDTNTDRNLLRACTLTRLSPHLQRAFRYYRSEAFYDSAADFAEGAAHANRMGFILIDENMRIIKASTEGERALARGIPADLCPQGRLRFRESELQDALETLIRRSFVKSRTFTCPRTDLRMVRLGASKAAEFFAGPVVAILFDATAANFRPTPLEIAAAYRLSPAEIRVLSGILSGNTIAKIAEIHNVKRETVRTQLKSIFYKTGTSCQIDLFRIALGMKNSKENPVKY
ncbi:MULTISPECIES: helix-turn-helix transcriptional regulator [unclassified Pannonibacter]|uniref:helix-turn-helix transcriptional regulator n=1 Tax=unclassified Pannonibacter TaxID=2627228 RepID=UPI00164544CD|nr:MULTISPECIES: LuxR C-terminal-related transcriptional regulator [unclassified Pannonibacter]